MGSTALSLVNDVLLLTGDYQLLDTINGSPSNVGARIVGFMNLSISDIEKKANWPVLRQDSIGLADGVSDTMAFSGAGSMIASAPVSAWITNQGPLIEVTPEQYDIIVSTRQMTGLPAIFQRSSSSSNNFQVRIHPLPAAGVEINVTGYMKATRFTNTDTSTTELDDDIIRYGALMRMDAYDGQDRGYASLFTNAVNSAVAQLYSNTNYRVMVDSYA